MCLDHLIADLLDYATNEQGFKSVTKAFKETGPETLARIVKRMCEPAKGLATTVSLERRADDTSSGRRAMIVDLALSVTGSQLIANVLPQASCFTSRHCEQSPQCAPGRQGSTYDALRVHQGPHRNPPWMQDRIQSYLAFVRVFIHLFEPGSDYSYSDRMVRYDGLVFLDEL